MDSVISQLDALYFKILISKVMSQRNALLKYFALNHVFENDTLTIYNEQLTSCNYIFEEKNLSQPSFLFLSTTTMPSRVLLKVYSSFMTTALFENDLLTLLQQNINRDRACSTLVLGFTKTIFHLRLIIPSKIWIAGTTKSF
jgi:DNA replication and repair protein RecF